MSKSDELRSRLPHVAVEMFEQIGEALENMRAAAKHHPKEGEVCQAWQKGLADALKLMRGCEVAHDRFRKWLEEVIAQEADHCGLTKEERDAIIGRSAA
jgi:hypothetical protein